jgi:putative aldouronate transport system substrate-binding protein
MEHSQKNGRPITRRQLLYIAAQAAALGGVSLAAACAPAAPAVQVQPTSAPAAPAVTSAPPQTPANPQPTTAPAVAAATAPTGRAASASKVPLPTYVPLPGITPDLPGSADGLVEGAFINHPANPIKSVPDKPGRGGDVSVITWTTQPPPTPMDSNALWQAVNAELGVTMRLNIHAQTDYATVKLPTIIAGNELPDILYMASNAVIPQLPTFLQSKMTDLTPYLSGDAVKEYPNLANIPGVAWNGVVFNNAIYGVPMPASMFVWTHWVHQNLLDDEGLAAPTNADEYKRLAQHFTRPNQNLYGLGSENNVGMGVTNGWLSGMFGAPNEWALDERTGKLTNTAETDAYKAAVAYARDLWAAGVYHPNALQYNLVSARTDFAARKFLFRFDGFLVASGGFWEAAARLTPPGNPRVMPPFGADATVRPTYWTSSGNTGYVVFKQAPPERIKELLRIVNWFAAPLGTQEYLLETYGLKDIHWTPDEAGNPVLNDRGKADATVPWHFIGRGPRFVYFPRTPDKTPIMHAAANAIAPYMSINPADAYYSATNGAKSASLSRTLVDRLNEIVVGREPFSAFDGAVKEWREGGGDQIRAEYEQAIAAARA